MIINKSSGEGNCIAEILSVINILQRNACPDNCLESCDRPTLGGGDNCLICNTRPVQIFTCLGNGVPFSMPTNKDLVTVCSNPEEITDNSECCSSVFRIEKIEGNCATFRVLAPNPNHKNKLPFIGTNSFFTFNLDCACAIRCLSDTFVECI